MMPSPVIEAPIVEPQNMVRYLGSTGDGDFMQESSYANGYATNGNGYAAQQSNAQMSQRAPYPYSTYSVPQEQEQPLGPKKVVSERVITREELAESGNLVEAPG